MPKVVVKRDGRKEPFVKEKIVVSVVKTGAPVKIAREIADTIDKNTREEVRTQWVRKQVLDTLECRNPDWPKRWYSYDKNVKRLHKHIK
jgi:transcriptional regulator NrdR family protein